MGLEHIAPLIDHDAREAVLADAWGHLVPVKNRTYRGRVVYAIGCYDSGDLNPTPVVADFKGLDSSPWFYRAIHEFLQHICQPDGRRHNEFNRDGCIYEWTGTFRNYKWKTDQHRLLLDPRKQVPWIGEVEKALVSANNAQTALAQNNQSGGLYYVNGVQDRLKRLLETQPRRERTKAH